MTEPVTIRVYHIHTKDRVYGEENRTIEADRHTGGEDESELCLYRGDELN